MMQRARLLTGIVLLIGALMALTPSARNQVATVDPEKANGGNRPERELYDPRAVALYQEQQQELKDALKAYFDKAIATGEIVGAGVSIVRGDSIVLAEGFGAKNSVDHSPVDGQTIFRLGSLSKGFAGVLAARLTAEGQLHFEDKVKDYIPGFQLGDRENTEKITLSHILSHTSGAPYHSYTNLVEAGLSLTEIAGRFGDVTPVAAPGTQYSYQNALFALSGEMIRTVTGQNISQLLTNLFFRPLGMNSTVMDFESLSQAENVALPHVKWHKGWKPKKLNHSYYNAIAAGGVNASSADMAKWMRFLLGHNPEVMGRAALENAFQPVVEIKGRAKYYHRWPGHQASYYGYGWRIHKFVEGDSDREITMWHHGGSVNNFRNEIALYPEADLGICVLLNSNSNLAKRVIPDLYEIVQSIYRKPTEHLALNSLQEPVSQ